MFGVKSAFRFGLNFWRVTCSRATCPGTLCRCSVHGSLSCWYCCPSGTSEPERPRLSRSPQGSETKPSDTQIRGGSFGLDRLCSIEAHPRSTVASQPGRLGVCAVVQLHVIVAAVGFLLDLKHLEDDLHAVTFLSRDHPQTVRAAGIVVISKLGMRVQILCLDLGLKASSAFWGNATTKLKRSKRGTRKECLPAGVTQRFRPTDLF